MRFFANLFPRKRAVYGGAAILLGLFAQPFALSARAAEPKTVQLPELSPRDWLLTNQARRAIQKDEQLSPLNLGVTVKNKVATIWGTIPSTEMAKRAEETLKKINGIAAVISECRIVVPDLVPQAVADAVKKARNEGEAPETSAKVSPGSTASRIVAKPDEGLAPKPVGDPNEVVPGAPLLNRPPAVVLLSPFTEEPPSNTRSVDSIEKVRLSESRFKGVVLEERDGVVKLHGIVPRMKDAWELADKLNALPGVKQVILGKLSEK